MGTAGESLSALPFPAPPSPPMSSGVASGLEKGLVPHRGLTLERCGRKGGKEKERGDVGTACLVLSWDQSQACQHQKAECHGTLEGPDTGRGRLFTLLFEHCFPLFLLLQPPTFFTYVKVCDFLIRGGGRLRSVHLPREIYGFRKSPLHFVGDIGTGATNELPPVHGVGIDEPKMSVVDLEGSGRAGKGGNGGEPRGQVRELTYQEHLPHI